MRQFPIREVGLGLSVALVIYLSALGVNVMPVLFLAFLGVTLVQTANLRGAGPASRPATSAASMVPNVRFEDIGGQAAAKRELLEALDFMQNREQIKKLGIRPLKGILLAGPPGTGKTMLAKAAANYTDSVFLESSGSSFVELYAGVGAQRVRDLFRKARELARRDRKTSAVVFIDEIEVLGARRGQNVSHMEYDQTLNELLVQMDGFTSDDEVQVLVMGATNRIDMLDPALLRPGRFDRVVSVDLPDKEGRLAVLQVHTRTRPLAEDVDLEDLARQTFGFSGAHLEAVVNEAGILALREGCDAIAMRHLTEAVDKVILGEKLDRKPTPEEKRRVAVHEAGHALVGEWVEPGSVSTVTITPRGRAMGYVRSNPADDRYLYTRLMLEGQMRVALAGFEAERLVFGEGSTGASGDFSRVVELARQIIHAGMSPLGVVDPEGSNQARQEEAMAEIIAGQRDQVRWYLEQRRPVLERVAGVLEQEEVIDGDTIRRLLAQAPPLPPEPAIEAAGSEARRD